MIGLRLHLYNLPAAGACTAQEAAFAIFAVKYVNFAAYSFPPHSDSLL